MINVTIGKENGIYRAISDGHANYENGNDPVCAAVSAIMYALMGSIENQTNTGKKRNKVELGHMDIRYAPGSKEDEATAAVIFNTAIVGLLQVEASYPENVNVEKFSKKVLPP